ncbi:MAG: SoxR reducing system RseC family protein [Candidatus Omnitrophota bacterium]
MIEKGTVLERVGDRIIVKIDRHSACGTCEAQKSSVSCGMNEKREMTLELPNIVGAQEKDIVEIELADAMILKWSALFYGAPLLGLVAGVLAGRSLAQIKAIALPAEPLSALTGIVFLVVALLAVKIYAASSREKPKPKVVRVVSSYFAHKRTS